MFSFAWFVDSSFSYNFYFWSIFLLDGREVWLKNFVALDSIKSLLCILICLGKCHVMVLGNSFAGRRRLLEN